MEKLILKNFFGTAHPSIEMRAAELPYVFKMAFLFGAISGTGIAFVIFVVMFNPFGLW